MICFMSSLYYLQIKKIKRIKLFFTKQGTFMGVLDGNLYKCAAMYKDLTRNKQKTMHCSWTSSYYDTLLFFYFRPSQ